MVIARAEQFIKRIDNFESLSLSEKTDLIIYFLQNELNINPVKKNDIENVFVGLRINGLSSLSSYLSNNSKKAKSQKFVKSENGILLSREYENRIKDKINETIEAVPTNSLFPFSLLTNTRGYIENIGKQAVIAYDHGLFDASMVMLRKLVEILIIELFEKKGIESEIKNSNNDYLYLSDLITKLLSNHSNHWNLSRNLRNGIGVIKRYGDLSAHNRRYLARKSDVDNIKDDVRIIIEELLILIEF
jgi:hypothetical protein